MLRDYRKNQLFNRRTAILTGIRYFLGSLLVVRLGYLQLGKHKEYATRSDKNRIKTIVQPALRGIIYDRNNKPLVANEQNYRLLLYLDNRSNVQNTIEELTKILGLSLETKDKLLERISNARRRTLISLIDSMSWGDVAKIEVSSYKLPDLSIESAPIRYYPFPFAVSHLLGYVSPPNEKEIDDQNQSLFMHPNFKIGKSGLEKSFDKYLRGKFGIKYSEVNAFGLQLREISTVPSINGKDLMLTINLDLQEFIFQKTIDKVASVVVIDVKTGEVVALSSSPSFNLNNFAEGFTKEYWQELTKNTGKPMNNKPLSANYPPGSVFKLMVALAALENGFNGNRQFHCNGKFRLGRRVFHCWKEGGHGTLYMQEAIKHSCNVYFFNVANELGIDKITAMAGKFGYGQAFDLDVQEVKTIPLPSDSWKRKVFKTPWVGGDTLNTTIGQGFMLASPIQIAVVTARIANGGIPIQPYVVKDDKLYPQYEELKNNPLAKKVNLDYVKKGMYRVINEPNGTAYGSRIMDKDFEMAGKTGTSQVVSKREKEMTKVEVEQNKNHAIFTGFAPFNDPKYAISVVVEHGGAGSAAAAPLGRIILEELKRLDDGGSPAITKEEPILTANPISE